MRLGLRKTSTETLTASVQQAARLCVDGVFLFLSGVTGRAPTAVGFVAEALGLQLEPGPLHHRWMTEELQDQRCGGAGCGGVSGEDQFYGCFLQGQNEIFELQQEVDLEQL